MSINVEVVTDVELLLDCVILEKDEWPEEQHCAKKKAKDSAKKIWSPLAIWIALMEINESVTISRKVRIRMIICVSIRPVNKLNILPALWRRLAHACWIMQRGQMWWTKRYSLWMNVDWNLRLHNHKTRLALWENAINFRAASNFGQKVVRTGKCGEGGAFVRRGGAA